MLEFPKWKYFLILLVLGLGVLYALPNVYQKDPSVQITANRSGQLDDALRSRVKDELAKAGVTPRSVEVEGDNLMVRLSSLDAQSKAEQRPAHHAGRELHRRAEPRLDRAGLALAPGRQADGAGP